jgi:hypothetical protein
MRFDGFWFANERGAFKSLSSRQPGWTTCHGKGCIQRLLGAFLRFARSSASPFIRPPTRGVTLWKEFDDTVFKMPKEGETEVVRKLNADFSKSWFGSSIYEHVHLWIPGPSLTADVDGENTKETRVVAVAPYLAMTIPIRRIKSETNPTLL